MAGFDVPHVTNDMMLRFMDVDFSLIPGIAAGSESKVGKVDRVHLGIADDKPGGVPILKGGNSGKEGEPFHVSCYWH
jgi:carboxypeptidase D